MGITSGVGESPHRQRKIPVILVKPCPIVFRTYVNEHISPLDKKASILQTVFSDAFS